MPRKEARIFTSIWQDDNFTALPVGAQRMYLMLISQPEISMCGVLTLAVSRWSATAPGLSAASVRADLEALEKAEPRPFVITDHATDEVLVRSFMRRDRVCRSPKLARPLAASLLMVRSQALRTVLRDELQAAIGSGEVCDALALLSDDLLKQLSAFSQVNTLSDTLSDTLSTREDGGGADTLADTLLTCDDEKTSENLARMRHEIALPQVNTLSHRVRRQEESFTGTTDNLRPDVERLCSQLADAIEANGSKRPPVGKAWRDACRLMLDRDGRTPEQIARAIAWCQADEFWRSNVMSMPALRRQYDRLRLAAQRGSQSRAGASTTDDRVRQALSLLEG